MTLSILYPLSPNLCTFIKHIVNYLEAFLNESIFIVLM